jgi:hypothetical protein
MADGILKVGTITTSSGSGTITLGQSGETVNVPSGATLNMSGATTTLSSDMKATPAFEAYVGTIVTGLSSATWTKVAANTEIYDTDSNYDTSNYRFTPTTAGKYLVYVNTCIGSASDYQMWGAFNAIYKNGSAIRMHNDNFNPSYDHNEASPFLSSVVDMNGSSDYVEAYARVYTGSGNWNIFTDAGGAKVSWFGAYRIIGA